MSLDILLVFALTEFLLSLTPGPAVLLVVSQGVRAGFAPSIRGTLGILTGNAIYFALSAAGLGALLLKSTRLFLILRWLGVAYLVFIGLKMLTTEATPPDVDHNGISPRRSARLFAQGLITQLSNPKAIVFFTALLPQFVSPDGPLFQQFAVLGTVSIAVEFPVLLTYGWLAQRGRDRVFKGRAAALPERIAGAVLIVVGAWLGALREP